MKIIKAGYEILPVNGQPLDGKALLRHIELCGRVCYKSEDQITNDSAEKFARNIIKRGHESVLEHASFSVRFIVDRGVSHEIVRHRLASYSQESTRYCNYSQDKFDSEITVIEPVFWASCSAQYYRWHDAMSKAEEAYFGELEGEASPQQARSVLPNSLKTEVVMTTNLREWRHFLRLRTSPAAHPQMREVTVPLLKELQKIIPVVFDDIEVEQHGQA